MVVIIVVYAILKEKSRMMALKQQLKFLHDSTIVGIVNKNETLTCIEPTENEEQTTD
jgi:glutamate 5-kinase